MFFLTVFVFLGLALFSGCASTRDETADEYMDDSMITLKANTIIVKEPEAHYLKIDVRQHIEMLCLRDREAKARLVE